MLLGHRTDRLAEQEIYRVGEIDVADYKHVRNHSHVIVRHTLCRPDGARPCRVWQNVEDEHLKGVANHQTLCASLKAPCAVEAVLLCEAAHEFHSLPRGCCALHRDMAEGVDAQQGLAPVTDGTGPIDPRASRLPDTQAVFVDDPIGGLKVCKGVGHLRDPSDGFVRCLARLGLIAAAPVSADVTRVVLDGEVDGSLSARCVVCRWHVAKPGIPIGFRVI
mmetsp:Transcript_106408/g.266648  ORF Transcript_106408/g.266648 Transcript_106408/m.266648 type:complete len:220 (+) Transcript_106408:297-956(+)